MNPLQWELNDRRKSLNTLKISLESSEGIFVCAAKEIFIRGGRKRHPPAEREEKETTEGIRNLEETKARERNEEFPIRIS